MGDPTFTLDTTAGVARPLVGMLDSLADESRAEWDSDGLHIDMVDAANVAGLELHVDASSVVGTGSVGLRFDALDLVGDARLPQDDDVTITLTTADGGQATTTLEREYDGVAVRREEYHALQDAGAVRGPGELDHITTDKCDTVATLPTAALRDAVEAMDRETWKPGTLFTATEDAVVLRTESETDTARAEFPVTPDRVDPNAVADMTSMYISDILPHTARLAEEVTVAWSADYPLILTFDSGPVDVTYRQAPRVRP